MDHMNRDQFRHFLPVDKPQDENLPQDVVNQLRERGSDVGNIPPNAFRDAYAKSSYHQGFRIPEEEDLGEQLFMHTMDVPEGKVLRGIVKHQPPEERQN